MSSFLDVIDRLPVKEFAAGSVLIEQGTHADQLFFLIEGNKPDFIFGGHIHNAPFARGGSWIDRIGDTWLFNPGQQIGEFPTHITIDLTAMRAKWVSFDREDERDLAVKAL